LQEEGDHFIKIDSAFNNLLAFQPSWTPSTTQQLRKLVAALSLAPDMTGRITIFDICKPLKMKESENYNFSIPSRQSLGEGYYGILQGEEEIFLDLGVRLPLHESQQVLTLPPGQS